MHHHQNPLEFPSLSIFGRSCSCGCLVTAEFRAVKAHFGVDITFGALRAHRAAWISAVAQTKIIRISAWSTMVCILVETENLVVLFYAC
jgi:hypothetical protein